jgi:diguanylate cyclase (GGDEF)-like protein
MSLRAPLDDPRRLAELRALDILDTAAEPEYDDLATLAAAVCRSPIGAVNFVDGQRHFTKAVVGTAEGEGESLPNRLSFCAMTIQEPDGELVVRDTRADARWREHPLVRGGPRVGSYVGVALTSRRERVGVICAFGPEARSFTDAERAALVALARQVGTQLELRRRTAELSRLAVTDPLTGLANRTLMLDRLEQALAARSRTGREVGVVFCDVDGFKEVNDRLGHQAGDRVLCDVGEDLRANVRGVDTVARIAGDEFVVVCPGVSASDLEEVVSRLSRPAARLLPDGVRAPRLSVGSILTTPADTAASALGRADAAMYAHKRLRPAARFQGAP